MAKIDAATVVVCDVTPVGTTPPIPGNEGDKPGRPLINPNVAIELGYAIGRLGDASVIGVINLAFGDTDTLPFDIKHKKVMYRLVEGSTKPEIEEQINVLRTEFIKRLGGFGVEKKETVFPETQPNIGNALFFIDGETLAIQRNNPISNGRVLNYSFSHQSLFYLRMIPKAPLPRPAQPSLRRGCILTAARMRKKTSSSRAAAHHLAAPSFSSACADMEPFWRGG